MSTSGYVYIKSEKAQTFPDGSHCNDLFTVGFYTPDGKWEPESDHTTTESAAARVHYLNGGAS